MLLLVSIIIPVVALFVIAPNGAGAGSTLSVTQTSQLTETFTADFVGIIVALIVGEIGWLVALIRAFQLQSCGWIFLLLFFNYMGALIYGCFAD